MIKLLQFTSYYIRKRLSVFLGLHRTKNPLTIQWRWRYWMDNYEEISKRGRQKEKPAFSKGKPNESY